MIDSESDFWRLRVKDALAGLDPVRIEDKSGQGVPDVNCSLGDIELKWVARPGKPATVFMKGALRPGQRGWLFRRWQAGGSAWCLIGIGEDHFMLLSGQEAALRMGKDACWGDMVVHRTPNNLLRTTLLGQLWHRTNGMLDRVRKLP